jgi:hypothetical protein
MVDDWLVIAEEGSAMTATRHAKEHCATSGNPPPRQSQDARQSISGLGFSPSAAVLAGLAGLRAANVPWWAFCLLTAFGLAAVCLRIVFPQNSPDKVAWWSERRRSRRRCQCQAEPCACQPRPAITSYHYRRTP